MTMTLKNTIVTIWKNKRHFKLQIFGVTVLLVVAIFIINLISIKTSYDKKVKDYMASTTKYTASFQMSLSGVKGTVENVFIDSSKTKCFILTQYATTSALTMNANNYQMFVTNVNNNGKRTGEPKEKLTGEIYMFGSSGLVGIYLRSDKPFENNLKQLTFRSYSKFTANTSPYFRTTATDAQYDQCHIFFNPGGSNSQTIDFLEQHVDGNDFNLPEIYRQVKAVYDEKTNRDSIVQFYNDIMVVMNSISEYQNRLITNYNVDVPEFPQYIAGDKFVDVPVYDAQGVQVSTYKKFIPATIVPGGTEFDWYNGSLATGYFRLVPNTQNMTIRDYIYALNIDKSSRRVGDMTTEEWYFKDGTAVRLKSDSTTTTYEQEIVNNIKGYEKQLNKYIELKTNYQTKYLPNLLLLESDSTSVGQSYTVRKDENTVMIY